MWLQRGSVSLLLLLVPCSLLLLCAGPLALVGLQQKEHIASMVGTFCLASLPRLCDPPTHLTLQGPCVEPQCAMPACAIRLLGGRAVEGSSPC